MDTLHFLYGTAPGRLLLRPLTAPRLSALAGRLLDSRASRVLVEPFVRRSGIAPGDYLPDRGRSFNDFFCRAIRPELRPVSTAPEALIAPCDGLLRVYPITEGLVLPVKESRYSVAALLRDTALARRFDGGWCLVYRLGVQHYHRYVYVESGEKHTDRRLPGVLHTVRPVALRAGPVFCENSRTYTVIETLQHGALVQMEVGAMLVGRIVNLRPGPCAVRRGAEKGYFEYGGSTVIVLTEPGRFTPHPLLSAQWETPVRLGEAVGVCKSGGEMQGL